MQYGSSEYTEIMWQMPGSADSAAEQGTDFFLTPQFSKM